MGLDMYLFRKKKGAAPKGRDDEEIAYWRKANAVRKYFVDKCGFPADGNCQPYPVKKEQLVTLVKICMDIWREYTWRVQEYTDEHPENTVQEMNDAVWADMQDYCEENLPSESGFFFGDTSYNDWYLNKLIYTAREITDVINFVDWDTEDVYYYEWW